MKQHLPPSPPGNPHSWVTYPTEQILELCETQKLAAHVSITERLNAAKKVRIFYLKWCIHPFWHHLTSLHPPQKEEFSTKKKFSVGKALTSRSSEKRGRLWSHRTSASIARRHLLAGVLEGGKVDRGKQTKGCFTCVCPPALRQGAESHRVWREVKGWWFYLRTSGFQWSMLMWRAEILIPREQE